MEHVGSLPPSQDLATAQYVKRDESSAGPNNFCAHVATTLNFRDMISKLHSVVFLSRMVGNTEIFTTPTAKHRFRAEHFSLTFDKIQRRNFSTPEFRKVLLRYF
jgi:hypothetical protein